MNFRKQVIADYPNNKRLLGPLSIEIYLYPPDRRVRDIDNTFKAILDSLKYINIIEDDSQIVTLQASKGAVTPGGLCLVTLKQIRYIPQPVEFIH